MSIPLGSEVKDKVSGIKGIATSRIEYMNGCIQYVISPKAKRASTEMPESYTLDVEQLVKIGPGMNVKPKRTGGPSSRVPAKTASRCRR